MQRVDVEERIEPVLVEQHEAHQHQRAGQHMSDVEGEAVHLEAPRNEHEQGGEQAEHQRCTQKFGHAEDAHLGDRGLEEGEQEAANSELGHIARHPDRER